MSKPPLAPGGGVISLNRVGVSAAAPFAIFHSSMLPWAVFAATVLLVVCFALGPILTRHRHARGEAQPYIPDGDTERWGIV